MWVLPTGSYTPVAPVEPVTPIVRKSKAAEKSSVERARTGAARTATARASHSTRTALDEMKLGG